MRRKSGGNGRPGGKSTSSSVNGDDGMIYVTVLGRILMALHPVHGPVEIKGSASVLYYFLCTREISNRSVSTE